MTIRPPFLFRGQGAWMPEERRYLPKWRRYLTPPKKKKNMGRFKQEPGVDPFPFGLLGSSLIAWWDANPDYWGRNGSITQVTGVSAWADIVAGYSVTQATGAAQPAYSTTGFNGAPCLTFDGDDDTLASTNATLVNTLPNGPSGSEVWALVSQDDVPSDTTVREIFSYGGSTTQAGRRCERNVVSGVNRQRGNTGDGGSSFQIAGPTSVDFTGRHVARYVFGASSQTVYLDGTQGSSQTITQGTGAVRVRVGATQVTTAAGFWKGKIAAILVTKELTAAQASGIHTWLTSRL